MAKVILVTGGAGFLGRNLCKKLLQDENHHVICIDNLVTGRTKNITEFTTNTQFRFIEQDITDPCFSTSFVEMLPERVHEIYHLACIASPPKYKEYSIETLMTSFVGTKNVLDLAKIYKAKVLFTSTSEVYGDPLVHPQPEEYFGNVNTFGERSCYDEGKRVAESLIYEYRRKFGLDAKIVRIFNTYGPYMDIDDGRVITNFIKQILAGKPLVIYGDGTQGRSFCYVDDMIDGLFRFMNSTEHGPMNIGNPYTEFTLNELVCQFESILGRKLEMTYIEATENDPKQRKPVIEKAQRLLGWVPVVGLAEGLKKTMTYFESH
jgi:UDP-glucuronate decarboxylase